MATPVDTPPGVTVASGSVEQLIVDEHATIRTHLSHLRDLARDLPTGDEISARQRVGAVLDFLSGGLLPHAAEQRAEAQRLLLVLEGLVCTHLWKEDVAYLPLLAQLDPAAYAALRASIAAHVGHQGPAH